MFQVETGTPLCLRDREAGAEAAENRETCWDPWERGAEGCHLQALVPGHLQGQTVAEEGRGRCGDNTESPRQRWCVEQHPHSSLACR